MPAITELETPMFGLGWQEWLVIGIVVLVVFGGSAKLPELAKSLGKAIREFKKSIKEVQSDVTHDDDDDKPAHDQSKPA